MVVLNQAEDRKQYPQNMAELHKNENTSLPAINLVKINNFLKIHVIIFHLAPKYAGVTVLAFKQ